MRNPIKDILDKESMIKDIAERENTICNYQRYGLLDRENLLYRLINRQTTSLSES